MAAISSTTGTGPLTAAGVGSGLDVESLVAQLVANKRKPLADQIATDQGTANTQISALGNISSALAALQDALTAFTNGTAFGTTKTSSSDNGVLTATSDKGTVNGTYQVTVQQLAAAQKVSSGGFADTKTSVGTGTLTISVGDKSMDLTLDPKNSSLASIRDAINKSSDNPGVTATIVTGTDGAHLVLASSQTGKENAFSVTSSGGDGGLAQLNFDAATGTGGMSLVNAAKDAQFTIDNQQVTSATNTVSDAIDGVTLNLLKASTDTSSATSTVTVSTDPGAATSAVNNLVTAYNSFIGLYQTLTKYDTNTNEVGAMIGDATLSSIKNTITNIITGPSSGTGSSFGSLSNIGISVQADGTLKVDSDALNKAMSTNPGGVAAMFNGDNGYSTKLTTNITNWTAKTGVLAARTDTLNQKLKDLDQQSDDLDVSMTALEARYRAQFTALDTMLTKLNSTSSFLTQQFDALTKPNS